MKRFANLKRLGFFTRLLDEAPPAERYRFAAEQIVRAEKAGLDSAWIAQHHFHEREGGLPSPFTFLGYVAAQTSRIRLGTGIVTLPLENAVRVAEDAAVLDLLCNGRFELGVGTGGNPSAFAAFGLDSAQRNEIFARNLDVVRTALVGKPLTGGDTLYPQRPQLDKRIWQATFSVAGGARAGKAGDGLLLSRTQPRTKEARRPRSPRSRTRSSMHISKRCRRDVSPGSWPRAASSSPTTGLKRCASPTSGCGARCRSSSRAVMPGRARRWRR